MYQYYVDFVNTIIGDGTSNYIDLGIVTDIFAVALTCTTIFLLIKAVISIFKWFGSCAWSK